MVCVHLCVYETTFLVYILTCVGMDVLNVRMHVSVGVCACACSLNLPRWY